MARNFNCDDCGLGLTFETEEELKNHKRKFCTGSGYADPAALDLRLAELKRGGDTANVRIDKGGIRDYLGGADRGGGSSYASPQKRASGGGKLTAASLIEQAENLERSIQANRQVQHHQNQDVLGLMKDLGERKERELRASIEKEEIARTIKSQNRQELGMLGQAKQGELEKLMADREAVRTKETKLMDDVARMERQLLQQEAHFRQQQAAADGGDPALRATAMRTLKEKEMVWAAERAGQVSSIKNERDRLEREREGIMNELARVQDGRGGSRGGFRANAAARQAGSALAFEKPPSGYGHRQPQIEPSLKDKLVADQVRLNKLKAEQRAGNENYDINDIDVLQREMGNHPSYAQGLQNLTQDYAGRQDPNQAEYLGVIRRRLEHEAAGPRSSPMHPSLAHAAAQRGDKDGGLIAKLDDLESLLRDGQQPGKGQRHVNPQEFPSQLHAAAPHMSQQQPMAPPSVDQHGSMLPGMAAYAQQQQFGYGQPTQWAPPQVGFPGQSLEASYLPQAGGDPALAQLASMLQNQDSENRKLREVLENFGKNTSTQEELGNAVTNANLELRQLGGGSALKEFGVEGRWKPSEREDAASPRDASNGQFVFPDEFLFRQNEARTADLEVEERALMNLAAQEYDQLRVIQRLPKGSDLYTYKLQQYKELSAMRAEVEKVLQEQRLEKIKRDFERQKVDEERTLRHQQWLENQKRQILEGRIGGEGGVPHQPYVAHERPVVAAHPQSDDSRGFSSEALPAPQRVGQAPSVRPAPQLGRAAGPVIDGFDPSVGALTQLDYAFGLPRQVRQLKVVFSAFTSAGAVGQPGLAGPSAAEADTNNRSLNKVALGARQLFTEVTAGPDSRIIFELQAVDTAQRSGFAGVGWTWIDLFQGRSQELWSGRWCLPVYAGATRPELTSSGGVGLEQAPGVTLCLRLGTPGDQLFRGKTDHLTQPADYVVHPAHVRGVQQPQPVRPPPEPRQEQASPVVDRSPSLKKPKRDPRYRCQGIRVRFHFAQQMKHYEKLTLRASLYEGEAGVARQQDGQPCEASAPSISDQTAIKGTKGSSVVVEPDGSVKVERGIGGAESQLKRDAIIRPLANFEFVWDRDFYNLHWDNDRQEPLLLVVEVFGRLAGAQGGRQAVAYAIFEICGRADGKLKYGQHIVPLSTPPITFNVDQRETRPNEAIVFSLLDPTVHREALAAGGRHESIVAPVQEERPETPAVSEQFVPNFEKQYTLSAGWLQNEGLDIYVDGTRHLPDNVSMTKLTVRIVDSDLKDLLPPESALPDIATSSSRNQRFNFQTELRMKKAKPTALVYLSFETVDISNNQIRIVGYSYFPLFIDARQGMPATADSITQISPHVGLYQMPIYWARVKEETPFTYERFVYLERVPTASVLIRVLKAPVDDAGKAVSTKGLPADQRQGRLVAAPEYDEGVYSTQYFQCSDDEKAVMTLRRQRPDAPMEATVQRLLLTHQRGEAPAALGPAGAEKLLLALIKTTKTTALIDLDYHSQYEPSLGVRINVEAIHDNKQKGFLAVLASIVPPASFYDASRIGKPTDAFVFSELDLDSTHVTQKFNEGDAGVLGFKAPGQGMSVLFDIKIYLPEKDEFTDYGFAIAPVLQALDTDADAGELEQYVNSGVFTLPIYKGRITANQVERLKASSTPLTTVAAMLTAKEIEYLPTASVIAKIVDGQRKLHFRESFEKKAPSTRFMDPKLASKYAYKPISGGIFGASPKKLSEMIPAAKQKDLVGFTKHLSKKFKAFVQL